MTIDQVIEALDGNDEVVESYVLLREMKLYLDVGHDHFNPETILKKLTCYEWLRLINSSILLFKPQGEKRNIFFQENVPFYFNRASAGFFHGFVGNRKFIKSNC